MSTQHQERVEQEPDQKHPGKDASIRDELFVGIGECEIALRRYVNLDNIKTAEKYMQYYFLEDWNDILLRQTTPNYPLKYADGIRLFSNVFTQNLPLTQIRLKDLLNTIPDIENKIITCLSINIAEIRITKRLRYLYKYNVIDCLNSLENHIYRVYECHTVSDSMNEINEIILLMQMRGMELAWSNFYMKERKKLYYVKFLRPWLQLIHAPPEIYQQSPKVAMVITGRLNSNNDQFHNFVRTQLPRGQTIDDVDIFVSYAKTDNQAMVEKFIQMYQPKFIAESDERFIDFSRFSTRQNIYAMMCMFLNRKKGCTYLKEYVARHPDMAPYDLVVSIRADLLLDTPLDYDYILDHMNSDAKELFIPNISYDFHGYNDQLAVGRWENMMVYLNLYDHVLEYCNNHTFENYFGEVLYFHHMQQNEINIKRFFVDYIINRNL